MRKSPLSLSILFFFIFLTLTRVAELTISLTLNRYSRIVSYAFQKDLGLKASFSKIDFSIASGLRFTDFYLHKDNDKVIFLKELRLGVFLPKLLRRELCIDKIFLREGWVPPGTAKYKDYLFFNLKRLIVDSRKRDTKSLSINFAHPRIYINKIKIYLDKSTPEADFVLINATVSQRRENL
ncbi:MAG: hypothetical protein Q8N14_03930, partial [Candidatus Omnitrophota bacterium]|nr:hypothetical protein [Candidatus Omnitrophota bacterium]